MTARLFGLFGSGGFARETMPLLRTSVLSRFGDEGADNQIVFVEPSPTASTVNGHRVLSDDEFFQADADERFMNAAIGDGRVRERLFEQAVDSGTRIISIFAENSLVLDGDEIGAGAVFSPFSMVTSNARIGQGFQCNIYSYVAHDCVVGDFVTFAPGVKCNGNVEIGNYAYLGTGAILRQGKPGKPLRIGEGAIVGMGAVVTKDVPDGATVIGNPARPMTV